MSPRDDQYGEVCSNIVLEGIIINRRVATSATVQGGDNDHRLIFPFEVSGIATVETSHSGSEARVGVSRDIGIKVIAGWWVAVAIIVPI